MNRFATRFALWASSLALGACTSLGGGGAAPSEAPTPSIPACEVTAGSLNVRAQASASAAVVGSLKQGTRVQAPRAESEGWLDVEAPDGTTGYVSSRYVRAVAAEPAAPAPEADLPAAEPMQA